jgi:hypothetical protein
MQFASFSSGGFVLHKVIIGRLRYSAWFDSSGKLLDAEGFDSRNRTHGVKRDGPVWQQLQLIGEGYFHGIFA